MVARAVVPVILCGGSGTRLWPLSRSDKPKQLLRLVGQHTMLQETALRLRSLELDIAPPIIVCNERHALAVAAQVSSLGDPVGALVLEPIGRNSAPAATVAALEVRAQLTDTSPLLLVVPADHVIGDTPAFAAAIRSALAPAAAGRLTAFGVVPTHAATGYGYVRKGADHGEWSEVAQFVEKPDEVTASAYLESGRYLWNSGMFLFTVDAWLNELARHAPGMLAACEKAVAGAARADSFVRLAESFRDCPADSIDYAVMEKTARAAVVPLAADWSDVGSWASLHDALPKDASGNAVNGDVVLDSCRGTLVSAHHRLVAAIGLNDVIIVETDDAVLVVAREYAEAVKRVAELISSRKTGRSAEQ